MSKSKSKKKKKQTSPTGERVVTENRKARHDYEVIDTIECGIVLVGSEVKSLRRGQCSINESYARVRDGEVFLIGCDIPEYVEANRFNHQPKRQRKLLLHRREIQKVVAKATQQGMTLVPLRVYFNRGLAKVLLGICRGRQRHDKREAIKRAESKRDLRRVMMRRR